MKRGLAVIAVAAGICFVACIGFAQGPADIKLGESLFTKHCALCHPNGGNIVNAAKTLHAKDREANNVKTKEDIVKLMRNPGPGMIKFGADVIPEKEAMAIAEYIMKTFNK